jgi:hypothetical protein
MTTESSQRDLYLGVAGGNIMRYLETGEEGA